MATYFTYSSEGIREDLADVIYSIAPESWGRSEVIQKR